MDMHLGGTVFIPLQYHEGINWSSGCFSQCRKPSNMIISFRQNFWLIL